MAYRIRYSDYPGTDTGPPDPERWVGPPGPPGPVGPQGPQGQPQTGGPFLPLSGGVVTGLTTFNAASAPNHVQLNPVAAGLATTNGEAQIQSYMASQSTGGNFYDHYSNIRADTTITGTGSTGINGVLSQITYQGSGGSAGFVPVYGQMNRRSANAGGTAQNPQIWGAVFEVNDFTNTDSAGTNYMSGVEIDMTVGNTDSANNRRALGIYLGKPNTTDVDPVCNLGIHVAANSGAYDYMLKFHGGYNNAVIDLTEATTIHAAANAIWLPTGTVGAIALDTSASLRLFGDGTGGMVLSGATGQPARITYQPNGNAGHNWWSGAWNDNNFYITDATTATNRVTISPIGAITLGGAVAVTSGISCGSQVGASNTDLSKHLALWGTNTGIGVSSGRLNILMGGGSAYFVSGSTDIGSIGPTGLTIGHAAIGGLTLDGGASFTLTGDGTGGMTITSTAGQPAIITYKPGSVASFWAGVWADGSYYISGGGGNRISIGPSGALTFNGSSMGFNNATPIAKPTGWGAPTGTATRTTFLTSSVTLPVLAEHVKALIDDLTAYGLIGP